MQDGKILLILIIVAVVLFFVMKIMNKFKIPRSNVLTLVTGGVKTGKTTFAVYMVLKTHKRNLRKVKFSNWFRSLLKMDLLEEPKIYSNIPLAVPYVPVTKELLLRQHRFNFGSVVLLSEASLVSNASDLKDYDRNVNMLEFYKLCAHELHGGQIVVDTQSVADLHNSLKKSISEYFYIYNLRKYPFFCIAEVREERYSYDNSVMSVYTDDVEASLRKVFIPKSTWKKFDCYCYSLLTDFLPVENKELLRDKHDLKISDYVSFMPHRTHKERLKDYEDRKEKAACSQVDEQNIQDRFIDISAISETAGEQSDCRPGTADRDNECEGEGGSKE